MVFLSNVSLAYEKVRQTNPWISEDILSFMQLYVPTRFECSRVATLSGRVALIDSTKCSFLLSKPLSRRSKFTCSSPGTHLPVLLSWLWDIRDIKIKRVRKEFVFKSTCIGSVVLFSFYWHSPCHFAFPLVSFNSTNGAPYSTFTPHSALWFASPERHVVR